MHTLYGIWLTRRSRVGWTKISTGCGRMRSSTDRATAQNCGERGTLRPIVADANLLLDIHSMQTNMPPLLLSGPLTKGRDLARQVGMPSLVVTDKGHSQGPRMRDYRGFSDQASANNALLVETGQHWAKRSADIAVETLVRFLRVSGIFKEFAPDIGTGVTKTTVCGDYGACDDHCG